MKRVFLSGVASKYDELEKRIAALRESPEDKIYFLKKIFFRHCNFWCI